MKSFIVRGTGSGGRRRVFWLDAKDAAGALRAAGSMGYADAVLMSDGETPPVNGKRPYPAWLHTRVLGAPNRFARVVGILLLVYVKSWPILAVVTVGAAGWFAYSRSPVPVMFWVLTAVVGPVILANRIAGGRTVLSKVHAKLLGGRRDEAMRLIPKLRKELRKMDKTRADFIVAGIEANVMAFRGRVADALERVRSFESADGVSEMEVRERELAVWTAADEMEEAMRVALRMTDIEPTNPSAWTGLAGMACVPYADAALGRWAMERVEALPISEMMRDGMNAVEGAVRIAEGRYPEAIESLRRAQRWVDRIRWATPLLGALEYEIAALRAIAYARLGDTDRARRWYASCERYLHAHRRTMLRERCLAAIEGRPEPFGHAPDVSAGTEDLGNAEVSGGVGSGA